LRALTIVNPAARAGRTRKRWPDIREQLYVRGVDSQFRFTTTPGEGTLLAREAVQAGFDMLIAVGGDGTANEVANGLLTSALNPVRLAVIPTGTGNDFARSLGIKNARDAIDRLALGGERKVDVGKARWERDGKTHSRFFLIECGTGFPTSVNRGVSGGWKRLGNTLPYAGRTLWNLRGPVAQATRWSIDGEQFGGRAAAIMACNGEFFGGGMRGAPGASMEDGQLDVMVVGDASRLDVLRILARIYSGRHLSHPTVSRRAASELRVEGDGVWFDLDGEVIGPTPVEVSALPGALSLAQ
jgi:YegS/Rv2252/BmrU family lipid kinase